MVFSKNADGEYIQKTLEYSGCFDEGMVIKPNETFDFEFEEEFEIDESKGVIFQYSDTYFRGYDLKFFEEI